MSRKIRLVVVSLCFLRSLDASSGTSQVEATSSEHVDFAAGGVIHVLNSFGNLSVEGWDRPEVEIIVTKSLERFYEPEQGEQAASALSKVRVVTERHSNTELQISTILPSRLFTRLAGGKGGFMRGAGAALDKLTGAVRHPLGGEGALMLECQIHVPRDSRLVIHHGTGRVLASDITGDVEVTSTGGDILLMLPDSGTYSIDARSKLGTVASDFEGSAHRRHLVGSRFNRSVQTSSRRIYLRTRIGGIIIKAVPVEATDPPTSSWSRRDDGTRAEHW